MSDRRALDDPLHVIFRLRLSSLTMCREAADEIERLERELAQCREDAERYRWIRAQGGYVTHWKPERLDADVGAAIDAARASAPG